jgi:hypothetical protein
MLRTSKLFVTALLGAAVLVPAAASAAAWRTCNGKAITWESGRFAVVRNRCSIADSGSRNESYWNAISQWRSVNGVIGDTLVWPADRCYLDHGDGWNDVAVVARADIDGNNGLTLVYSDGCTWWFSTEHLSETDVMVASDMTFTNPDESQAVTDSGRMTFAHEFGHAHGLIHSESFGVMRTYQPRPLAGGTGDHVSILPDDATGIRALYGGPAYQNLIASAQMISGSSVVTTNAPGTVYVCRNQLINPAFSFANTGSLAVNSFRIRLFINNVAPPAGFTGGWDLGYWFGWISGTGSYSGTFGARVPNVPVGLYWIYFRVDDNNLVSELREHDNVTHNAMRLYVMNCSG